jgi:hypothetical protein
MSWPSCIGEAFLLGPLAESPVGVFRRDTILPAAGDKNRRLVFKEGCHDIAQDDPLSHPLSTRGDLSKTSLLKDTLRTGSGHRKQSVCLFGRYPPA